MIARKIRALLDREHVPYEVLPHAPVPTALETAHATHVPGAQFAKVTVLDVDGKLTMAVLPAGRLVDLGRMCEILGAKEVSLATEARFARFFRDCEPGAEPPFGRLYRMDVYADIDVTNGPDITFNAGTHREAVRMATADWKRLAAPVIASFSILPSDKHDHPQEWRGLTESFS